MALIPAELKTILKLLSSINISLGRIATALEKQNERGNKNDDCNERLGGNDIQD